MPKQILLVDDSVTIARVVEITFAQEDYALTTVKTGDEGIEKARQLKPDLVLVDAGLTGKSAYDVVAALRQDAGLAKTSILLLTGNFTPYDEAKGGSAGADGFVVKPFETQAMIDKAKDAISRRAGGEASAPAAAAQSTGVPQPIAAAPRPGVESLSKPLSTVAAETSARVSVQPVAAKPGVPGQAPVAQQRPAPKATLMGIPAVNPAGLVPPAATPPVAGTPAAPKPMPAPLVPPPKAAPVQPAPVQADVPKPIHVEASKVHAEPPRPAPVQPQAPKPVLHAEPARPVAAEPVRPTAAQHTLPHSVPQMPRPSLVPGVATPTARVPEAPRPVEAAPARNEHQGMGAVVREVADRVPAAISAKGPEYDALTKLSREVIEQIVWEVVPELAETIIRAELDRLVRERQNA